MNADELEAEDEETLAYVYMLTLPSEIVLHILSFVAVSDIASFRQTCRLAELFTRDRSLWLALLGCQRQWLPLPREAVEKASLHLLSSSRLEEIVSMVYYGQLRWLSKRTKALQLRGTPDDHSDILCLAYLLDNLVLGVYTNGAIALWDPLRSSTGRIDPISLWELWGREPWTSALACLDISGDAVYVVVSRTHSRVQNGSTTVLMRISLPSPYSQSYKSIGAQQAEQFDNESVLFGPDNQIARAIDPERRLLAFSRISFIEIVHWPTKTGISIDTQTADLEDLWNGTIGMRFVGPYLFCARTRSIELYDVSSPFLEGLQYSALPTLRPTASNPLTSQIPLRSKPLPPIASYMFPSLSLRTVSISAPFPPITKAGVTTTTLTFLANDVLRGLFHYRIDILVSSDSTPPSVDLQMHLIGAYTGLNGFVGAAALGQQSLRGVWIERSRNTTSRRVMAFTTSQQAFSAAAEIRTPDTATVMEPNDDDERSEDGELSSSDSIQPAASGESTLPIDGQTVYDIHSYDLREDLMHVAFSEVTGHIALGTRSGNVRII